MATAAEDRLNLAAQLAKRLFAAASDCRTIAIYEYSRPRRGGIVACGLRAVIARCIAATNFASIRISFSRLQPSVGTFRCPTATSYGRAPSQIAALEPKKLTRLFLTHLHFDHTEGMTEFMLSPWTLERKEAPQVYGPPGTADMVNHLMQAYAKDIYIQMFGLERTNATGWKWLAKEVLPGEVYKDDNVQITAYQNKHGSRDYSYAYRVVTSKPDGTVDRTIVFSGDTALFDGMEEVYAGADILFHEAYSFRSEDQ